MINATKYCKKRNNLEKYLQIGLDDLVNWLELLLM